MKIFPEYSAFEASYTAGHNQLLYMRLAADLDTPVGLMLKLAGPSRDSFMLESVNGGEQRGRYSFIGLKPDLVWECHGDKARINRQARVDRGAFESCSEGALESLRSLLDECRIDIPEGLPSASAGLFGYLSYDMIRLVEKLPEPGPDPIGLPDARLLRPSLIAVLDGARSEVILVAPVWVGNGSSARGAYAQAAERLMDAARDLERVPSSSAHFPQSSLGAIEPKSNFSREGYYQAVEKAREYIGAGDIFQVVPAQRWYQEFTLPPFFFYRALRQNNPSPYMFYFDFGDAQIIGASPESLVRLENGRITIRPIAGTRPRGTTPQQDDLFEKDLLSDKKELAEHLMLLDLGRNDVGRVAKTGSVIPTEKFVIERYSHVMHIVSNVEGEISEGHDALSALLAGLPAGTLSGAPKVRAMEIINELEPEKRGVYGGGVGYFSSDGDMDMCIALRMAIVKDQKLYSQAGGGVVWDSTPEGEYDETVNKAKAIWQAAQDAAKFGERGNY